VDYQILFNGAVIVASFFGGWTLNTITRSLERLDNDVRNMPHAYVSKEDYRNDIKEVKEMLGKIFDRLETKADK